MAVNVLLGFILPWLFCIYLIKKDMKTLLTIAPFTALVSSIINDIGVYVQWWLLVPVHLESVSTFPFNIGLYPVWGSYMIHYIKHYRMNPFFMVIAVAFLLTLIESSLMLFDRLFYGNGWNLLWTLVSYLVTYALVYGYFHVLQRTQTK